MKKTIAILGTLAFTLALAGPLSAKELFKADLRGNKEIPPVTTRTKGKVELRLRNDESSMEITLRVQRGTDVTMAHIHCGAKNENGPVVVWLAGLIETGLDVDGKWIGKASFNDGDIVDATCGTTVAELAQSIRDGNAYVNVHTLANPSGEIRGQLRGRGKGKK